MLKKIVSINNVGKFRKSAAAGDTAFAKRTLIVGANGFGKTTLCAVLRSLKTGEPSNLTGRKTLGATDPPTVEILHDGGTARFDGTTWSSTYPALEVFDGAFVAENVHSGEVVDIEHKRNFYRVIIGEKGVALADQDTALAAESREKTGEITAAQRAIQPHIPRGMTLDAFVALPQEAEIDRLIAEQERTVEGVREAARIKARAPYPNFPFRNCRRTSPIFLPARSTTSGRMRSGGWTNISRRMGCRRTAVRGSPTESSTQPATTVPSAGKT
jgi:wobble nucleotide-excising tRNase